MHTYLRTGPPRRLPYLRWCRHASSAGFGAASFPGASSPDASRA